MLKTYELVDITVGLPYYEPVKEERPFMQFVERLDRMVKTSCELGLHWARCDPAKKPFQTLLNMTSKLLNHQVELKRHNKLATPPRLL